MYIQTFPGGRGDAELVAWRTLVGQGALTRMPKTRRFAHLVRNVRSIKFVLAQLVVFS